MKMWCECLATIAEAYSYYLHGRYDSDTFWFRYIQLLKNHAGSHA